MNSVLVLGAGGYVGGAIASALVRSGRHRPIGAGRHPSRRLADMGVEIRICDATDAGAVRKAAEGAGCIVNAVLGERETMIAATRHACDAAGDTRVVHVSTMSVYGAASGKVDETASLGPADSPYGATKIACEEVLASFVANGGDAVILRPGIVHGPAGEQWTGRLGRMLRLGRLGDLGEGGDGRCNLTYIEDLGQAALAAVERPEARGQAFNVAVPDPPTWNQYLVALGVLIGATPVRRLSPRRLKLEGKLLAPPLQVLKLLGLRAGLAQGLLPEPIPPSLLRLFSQDMELDHRKADRILGFPRTPPAVALEAAASWFRRAHGPSAVPSG